MKAVEQAYAFAAHLEKMDSIMWRSKRIRWENTFRELEEAGQWRQGLGWNYDIRRIIYNFQKRV